MQLQHSFELPSNVDSAWALLNRVEEIAPCLPGASVTKVDEDHYQVTLRIRLGPLDLSFKGTIEILERDNAAHKLVLKTKANDARGQGSASGTTTATLSLKGDQTHVALNTELAIAGRVAQMGRGMVADVSNDLLDHFVTNLKQRFIDLPKTPPMSAQTASPTPGAATAQPTSSPRNDDSYVDMGAIVRRAIWRRFVSFFLFWRRR